MCRQGKCLVRTGFLLDVDWAAGIAGMCEDVRVRV
jgi:hypothetical protein